jgi:hypothetical protein
MKESTMTTGKAHVAIGFMGLWSAAIAAWGNAIYVSPGGSDRNNGASVRTPLRTLATAADRAAPGDTVYLLPGQFNEALVPANAGEPGQPITYKSITPGAAMISNVNVGILVNSLAYIVIDGISVDGLREPPNATVNTFLAVQNSNHITVQNVTFRRANGWAGVDISGFYSNDGLYWEDMPKNTPRQGSTSYVTLQDSTIDNVGEYATPSGDAIQVAYGRVQHTLIQGNTITHGGHDLVEFDGDYGVLQDNLLNNSYRDIAGGDTGYRSIEVQGSFNVVQRNLMEHARFGGGGYVAPVAVIRGDDNIVRQNALYDGITYGLGVWCATSSPTVENLRIYNNTLYDIGGAAWAVYAYAGCETLSHHVFANNLVMNSRMSTGTLPGVYHGSTVPDDDVLFAVMGGSGLVNVGQGPTAQSAVKGNLFWPESGGPAYVMLDGAEGRIPLSVASGQYPQFFSANLVSRPTFVSASPRALADFRLEPSSPGVAAGTFLTHAVCSATSNRLSVQDSLYFTDGNGVIPGDTIELEGTTDRATIVAIDHSSHTLTLSTPVAFTNGQGVALPYNGTAPDIGIGSAP